MPALSMILLAHARYPDPARVVASAQKLGLSLTASSDGDAEDGPQGYMLGDAPIFLMLVRAPHPDAAHMGFGPTAIEAADAVAAPAHLIVTVMAPEGAPKDDDLRLAALTAAVIENVEAVGAMLGHGVLFHKPALFAQLAALGAKTGALPAELAVDITTAHESETHMSFLTHNLPRYGREDFYVTCPITGQGALELLFGLVRWMLMDPNKHLPTGDTIGRTPSEKVTIQRVPSPLDNGDTVIRLDLP